MYINTGCACILYLSQKYVLHLKFIITLVVGEVGGGPKLLKYTCISYVHVLHTYNNNALCKCQLYTFVIIIIIIIIFRIKIKCSNYFYLENINATVSHVYFSPLLVMSIYNIQTINDKIET